MTIHWKAVEQYFTVVLFADSQHDYILSTTGRHGSVYHQAETSRIIRAPNQVSQSQVLSMQMTEITK